MMQTNTQAEVLQEKLQQKVLASCQVTHMREKNFFFFLAEYYTSFIEIVPASARGFFFSSVILRAH